MRFLNTLLAAALGLLVVLFAVSNLGPVSVEIWPFPFRIEAGLYVVILAALFVGFGVGSLLAWMGGSDKRRELRAARKRMREMEQSLARLKEDAAAARAKAELSPLPKI